MGVAIWLLYVVVRSIRVPTAVVLAAATLTLAGCGDPPAPMGSPVPTSSTAAARPPAAPEPAQPRLAADPAQLARDLVDDEQVLRDRNAPEAVAVAAARRQQLAYRELGRHPEWDPITRALIPRPLLGQDT